jgi:DNA-binding transcriptional MerR regulator
MARSTENQPHRLPLAQSAAAVAPPDEPAAPIAVDRPAGEGSEDDLLQVGDLARLCNKTVRAIHLYEELGLLKPHARSKGRYRLFSKDAVVRVRWIGKLQDLGLSLSTIQTVVREWETSPSAPGAMAKMRDVYRQKLASTRAQIERLRALESELADSLRYLETCDSCDPARLFAACTCCDLHEHDQTPPELVAGFRAT